MTDNQTIQSLPELIAVLSRKLEPFQPFLQSMERISQAITPFLEEMAPYIEYFARYSKFIESVRPTGWLPYHTVSIDCVEECGGDVSFLEAYLTNFYETNWENIQQDIEKRLDHYHIAEETKATFREVLSAHVIGHYRCVCRVLFPEIDREFRIHFFEDSAGSISSKKMLEKFNNQTTLRNVLPREAYGWILFNRLIHHLYEPVDDGNRAHYENDYVPNRHASTHGLVSYSTFKHSMNMIIMADYIFQVLTSTAELRIGADRTPAVGEAVLLPPSA